MTGMTKISLERPVRNLVVVRETEGVRMWVVASF